MTDFVTKDSGERREFGTGSVRDVREGKGRFDLVPFHALRRLAQLYERGSRKYGDDNWTLGQPLRSYVDSMLRHANQASAGFTDEDHLAAVAWNAFAIMDHQERIKRGELSAELDDLPRPRFEGADQTQPEPKVDCYFPSITFDFPAEALDVLCGGVVAAKGAVPSPSSEEQRMLTPATTGFIGGLRDADPKQVDEDSWLLHNDGNRNPLFGPISGGDESSSDAIARIAARGDQVETVNGTAHRASIHISAGPA